MSSAVVLYSGGTDSTCAAALMAESHEVLHLLTFYEHATRRSPLPTKNIEALARVFPDVQFQSKALSVDRLVRRISYHRYGHFLWRYRWMVLANAGFSSLSWHVRTLVYCLEHGIEEVADGLTRELMHFPGHMDEVVELLREFYLGYGIRYHNPVREWPTPPDQQFLDRMVVNTHGGEFFLEDQNPARHKTTGRHLFDIGVLPEVNVKGSPLDFSMQHDCYPFALYNVLAFWGLLAFQPYPVMCRRMAALMAEKLADLRLLVEEHRATPETSRLAKLL